MKSGARRTLRIIEIGATEYATKLHQCEEDNSILKDEIQNLSGLLREKDTRLHEVQQENEKLKEQVTGWRPLLEGALKDNGLTAMYPDHFIEKIKRFLYGE